ncbi:hypothetical protein [Paractinoplanes abujensis]|uniref:Uncharacterized protein n=1 Tax=Paractinoplanes abujensis TaxID=882441 RepID=A0A7W7CT09_9ACTN|nr:hypothetical protein [Actinoplanes abujensis]MBB4693814.1 hypothetical protein [Actinoplanes abujensis]
MTGAVRNSELLGILVAIVQGPQGRLQAVELAGRGLAAAARCDLAVMADKHSVYTEPEPVLIERSLAFADRAVELGEIIDGLADLWRSRRTGEIGDPAFEAALGDLVRRIEEWPGRAFPGL